MPIPFSIDFWIRFWSWNPPKIRPNDLQKPSKNQSKNRTKKSSKFHHLFDVFFVFCHMPKLFFSFAGPILSWVRAFQPFTKNTFRNHPKKHSKIIKKSTQNQLKIHSQIISSFSSIFCMKNASPGSHFESKMASKTHPKTYSKFDLFFDRFWKAFWMKNWSFLNDFSETVILWKIAPRLYEITIFRVLRLRKSIKNRSENGIENNIDFWMGFWWILDRFWRFFGFKNRSKSLSISGSIFGWLKNGTAWFENPDLQLQDLT